MKKLIKTIALAAVCMAAVSAPVQAEQNVVSKEQPKTAQNVKQSGTVKTYGNKIPEAYTGISKRK